MCGRTGWRLQNCASLYVALPTAASFECDHDRTTDKGSAGRVTADMYRSEHPTGEAPNRRSGRVFFIAPRPVPGRFKVKGTARPAGWRL